MNQLMVWRSLLAIAFIPAFIPTAAHAQWLRQGIETWRRATQPAPNYDRYAAPGDAAPLNPIGRNGFGYINQMGSGQDELGYYRQPVPVRSAFGTDLSTGTYEAPATWDETVGIRYRVENGAIVQQNYQFYPQGRQ